MKKQIDETTWVWAVVLNPEKNEQLLGQHDKEHNISFIPIFLEKDEAARGTRYVSVEKGQKYEAQAILYEDICRYAAENGFMVFILNGDGDVIDKIQP